MLPSGGELLVVIFVVFLLFGGRELPKIARTMGKWTSVMKRSLNDVRREFNRISIQEELREASKSVKDMTDDPLGLKNLDSPPNKGKTATRRSEEPVEPATSEPEQPVADNADDDEKPQIRPSSGVVSKGSDQEKLDLDDRAEAEPEKE